MDNMNIGSYEDCLRTSWQEDTNPCVNINFVRPIEGDPAFKYRVSYHDRPASVEACRFVGLCLHYGSVEELAEDMVNSIFAARWKLVDEGIFTPHNLTIGLDFKRYWLYNLLDWDQFCDEYEVPHKAKIELSKDKDWGSRRGKPIHGYPSSESYLPFKYRGKERGLVDFSERQKGITREALLHICDSYGADSELNEEIYFNERRLAPGGVCFETGDERREREIYLRTAHGNDFDEIGADLMGDLQKAKRLLRENFVRQVQEGLGPCALNFQTIG